MDCVSFGKLTGFQGSHFVCGGEGGMLVEVCESKYVSELMRFEWWSLGVMVDVLGWVGE